MDDKLIYSLWDRFEKSAAVELIYESGDYKLKLRKAEPVEKKVYNGCITQAGPQADLSGTQQVSLTAAADTAAAFASSQETANAAVASSNAQTEDLAVYVRSPLPGTFYRSASPNDEPYVMIGSKVKQGDVVGIVESMKMMNEIVAPADGTVAEIIAENAAIVGFDDKLIRLE